MEVSMFKLQSILLSRFADTIVPTEIFRQKKISI